MKRYKQNPLEEMFIFTICQNYTNGFNVKMAAVAG